VGVQPLQRALDDALGVLPFRAEAREHQEDGVVHVRPVAHGIPSHAAHALQAVHFPSNFFTASRTAFGFWTPLPPPAPPRPPPLAPHLPPLRPAPARPTPPPGPPPAPTPRQPQTAAAAHRHRDPVRRAGPGRPPESRPGARLTATAVAGDDEHELGVRLLRL